MSLLTIVFLLILAWGTWQGYKIGGILSVVSFSVFIILSIISIGMSIFVYYLFVGRSSIPEIFGSLVLAVTIGLSIRISNIVHSATIKRVSVIQNDKPNQIIGAIIGFIKYFLIAGFYVVVLYNINCKGNILPQSERSNKFLKGVYSVVGGLFGIRMQVNNQPCFDDYIQEKPQKSYFESKDYTKEKNDTTKENKIKKKESSLPIEDVK